MSVLKTKDLKKHYGTEPNVVKALDGVNVEIKEGEFIAVVGTSGSGKSTLLHMLGGLDRATSGKVWVSNKDIFSMSNDELTVFRRRNIGFVFQNYNLVPILNVYENITLPVELDGGVVDKVFLNSIIKTLGLESKLKNMPNNLSGGQQQRVAIARALAVKPAIILADEPTGNLDSKTSIEVIGLLKITSKKFNQTIVMITHNQEIAQLADRIILIEDGKIIGGKSMRFANNNKAIINKLTKRSVKANKLRNLIAIIAITLTTILFTSLFTIAMGMGESMQQQTMRQVGGYAHGSFKGLTQEEFDNIKNHRLIKELGYSIMVGMAENEELTKRHAEVRYATDTQAEMFFSNPTTGRMPQNENEIATDTIVLELLGVLPKIGEKINVEYIIDGKKISSEFILSGFWESDKMSTASMMFVSREFIDKFLAGINIDKLNSNEMDTGLIFVDVMFKNSLNIDRNLKKVLIDSGYSCYESDVNYIKSGTNWAYLSTNFDFDFTTVIGILSICLLIIFTGYLIIYNIFQISVLKDIRFYGLLKTIGTTPKQIRNIVRKQAFLLSVIGIPSGLVIGYLIGNVLLPIIMETTTAKTSYISFSPLIFICATIFSFITVFISCRKPSTIAARISPIEATRYVDVSISNQKKRRIHWMVGKYIRWLFLICSDSRRKLL